MGMGRYVVDAVLLEGRSAREVARAHGISKSWIYELIGRYRAGGYEALEPHSRRPRSCQHETRAEIVRAIVKLRGELDSQGHDAGAETISYHLAQRYQEIPSVSTIWRILRREGLVVHEPKKRPRSSWIRFCAELPNELWQVDVTCWALASGPKTLRELQGQLDAFRHYYNHIRPHRAIGRRTPLQAYSARVKATPAGTSAAPYFRVRQDRVDATGKVSLRYESRLYKIGLGRAHKGREVRLLIADQNIRVIDSDG